jgi:Fe-S oxidoreductase
MEKDEAQLAIKRLIEGKEASRVFDECTLCFNCNNYCPIEGLRPHELIQQRMLEHRGKVPEFIKYLLNSMPSPTIWQDAYGKLNDDEQDILDRWSPIPPPSKEILFIGCIGKATSAYDIEHSEVLKELPKFGPPDICCGELHYRLGGWDAYTTMIEKTLQRFSKLDIERMVCYCGSCYNFLSNILPKVYGKKLPFKVISMYEWMWERVESGKLELKKPLKFRAAVHESCYVSELGSQFPEILRKLYTAAGAELTELEHHGKDNITCGFVSMARKGNFPQAFFSMVKEQNKKYREARNADVKDMVLNCPGCFIGLSFTNFFRSVKLRYMPDELLRAYGDKITTPIEKRFGLFLMLLIKSMPRLLFHRGHNPDGFTIDKDSNLTDTRKSGL